MPRLRAVHARGKSLVRAHIGHLVVAVSLIVRQVATLAGEQPLERLKMHMVIIWTKKDDN